MPWGKVLQESTDREYDQASGTVKPAKSVFIEIDPSLVDSYPSLRMGQEGYLDNGDIINITGMPGSPRVVGKTQLGLKVSGKSSNRTLVTFDPQEGGTWFLNEAKRRIPSSLNILKGGPGGIAIRYGDVKHDIERGYTFPGAGRLDAGKKALIEVDRLNGQPSIYSAPGLTGTAEKVAEKAREVKEEVEKKAGGFLDNISYEAKLFGGLTIAAFVGYGLLTRKD